MEQIYTDSFELSAKEYLITSADSSAKDYKILYKGEVITDVVGIIRNGAL